MWDYGEVPMTRNVFTLMMGTIIIDEVYQTPGNEWRVVCHLPDSYEHGGKFVKDYPTPGVAKSTLELVCVAWVNKTGLWSL